MQISNSQKNSMNFLKKVLKFNSNIAGNSSTVSDVTPEKTSKIKLN